MELRYGNLVTQARDALNLEIPLLRVVDVCSASCSRSKSLNPPQPWVTDGSKQGLWVPTPSQSTPSQKGQDPALFPHLLPLLFRERGFQLGRSGESWHAVDWPADSLRSKSSLGTLASALMPPLSSRPSIHNQSGFLLQPQVSGQGPGRKEGTSRTASFHSCPPITQGQVFFLRVAGKHGISPSPALLLKIFSFSRFCHPLTPPPKHCTLLHSSS